MTRGLAIVLWLVVSTVAAADEPRYTYVSADRIEYQSDVERRVWDLQGWHGGDINKLWWKFEGSSAADTESELQFLYSRAISPYFDAQIGVRVADNPDETESAFVIGIMGLAPYNIEMDIAASVDTDGDFSVHGEFEHDVRFSQRIVLQPRLELRASSASTDQAALEVRLRYELSRKIAPYLGISWQRHAADTTGDGSSTALIAGLRFWF
jgi:copper resistance protein B